MSPSLVSILWQRPQAWLVLVLSVLVAALVIALLTWALPAGSPAALVILDYQATPPPNYPFVYPFILVPFQFSAGKAL